jgi:hypothetical protein
VEEQNKVALDWFYKLLAEETQKTGRIQEALTDQGHSANIITTLPNVT